MAIHVMSDIETWNLSPSAPLLVEIGAVKFDGEQVIDRFHVAIDPADAERYGFVPDAKTMLYWMDEKRAEARANWLGLPKVDLYAAIDGWSQWCGLTPMDQRGSHWGKGATFDNVRLKAVCDRLQLEYPFTYRQDECYRTLANRVPHVGYTQLGTAHVGVDDAESQAVHLIQIAKYLGIEL